MPRSFGAGRLSPAALPLPGGGTAGSVGTLRVVFAAPWRPGEIAARGGGTGGRGVRASQWSERGAPLRPPPLRRRKDAGPVLSGVVSVPSVPCGGERMKEFIVLSEGDLSSFMNCNTFPLFGGF